MKAQCEVAWEPNGLKLHKRMIRIVGIETEQNVQGLCTAPPMVKDPMSCSRNYNHLVLAIAYNEFRQRLLLARHPFQASNGHNYDFNALPIIAANAMGQMVCATFIASTTLSVQEDWVRFFKSAAATARTNTLSANVSPRDNLSGLIYLGKE